jgi:hypothetical protein
MIEENYPEIAPSFLVIYEHDRGEFRAVIDAMEHSAELQEALYERVRTWTVLHGVVLGEGYIRPWTTSCDPWSASITLVAPVISSELEADTYGFFLADGTKESV